MIPQFPQFKKLELSDRTDVEVHTNLYESYSDFCFTCLWIWDTDDKRMISELNGNLVVLFTDYMTGEPFLSFLGAHNCEESARTLLDYCKSNNLPTTLRLIPDVSISNINKISFVVEESRGDFDYILSIKELVSLAGTQFHRKRKNANRFWRENPTARMESAKFSDLDVQRQIFKTIEIWENNKVVMKKDYALDHELIAIKRLYKSDKQNTLIVFGLFLGDTMLGFAISEILLNGYAIVHFMKSNILYNGSNEALMQGLTQHLNTLSVEYINIESDLEFDSMRQAKMSWRPIKFLKRYNVRYPQS